MSQRLLHKSQNFTLCPLLCCACPCLAVGPLVLGSHLQPWISLAGIILRIVAFLAQLLSS